MFRASLTQSLARLWIGSIILHHAVLWDKALGVSLGSTLGVFDDCDTPSTAPHMNVLWIWLSWGGGGLLCSWASLCDRGWMFITPDQRLHHTPRALLLPLGGRVESVQTWQQEIRLRAKASPRLKLGMDDFQDSCWARPSYGCSSSLICFFPDLRWLNKSVTLSYLRFS